MSLPFKNEKERNLFLDIRKTLTQEDKVIWLAQSENIPNSQYMQKYKDFALESHKHRWYMQRIDAGLDQINPITDIKGYKEASLLNKIYLLIESYQDFQNTRDRYQDFLDSKW